VTDVKFGGMTEKEHRDLAWRLAEGSEVFDFEKALEVVQWDPARAEKLVRDRERRKMLLEELAQANRRLHLSAQEFR
jgi:hypothetical protein